MKYQAWALTVHNDGSLWSSIHATPGSAWEELLDLYGQDIEEWLEDELSLDQVRGRIDAMFEEDRNEIRDAANSAGIDFTIEETVIHTDNLKRI